MPDKTELDCPFCGHSIRVDNRLETFFVGDFPMHEIKDTGGVTCPVGGVPIIEVQIINEKKENKYEQKDRGRR